MRKVKGWKKARPLLEGWRRTLTDVQVRLKRPRVVEMIPVDFTTGEPVMRKGAPRKSFTAKLIHFTDDDLTLRRASGALVVIDTYELQSITDRKLQVEP